MSFLQIPIGTYPNTFLGYQSSIGITTGTGDTAFGYLTLNANTTGSDNSAFGSEALRFNVSGSRNTAGGATALLINNANNNTAFGYASQRGNVNGQDNSSFGHDSMRVGDDGNENSAFGSGALYNAANTQGNSGFGYLSLYNVTSGLKNSAFGWASGSLITTGSKNSILGSYSGNQGGLDIRTLSNYIVLSDGDGNPRLWIDNTGAVNIPGGFVLPGGTANGVLYLNGSKVVTSGSALTFNGTNLGVGTASPTLLFQVGSRGGMDSTGIFRWGSALTGNNRGVLSWDTNIASIGAPQNLVFCANSETTERMRLDSSGNLGLGAVPSAWGSNHRAVNIAGASTGHVVAPVNSLSTGTNYYNDNTNFLYATTGQSATRYAQNVGQHQWFIAPSGTAGNAISFTQAMTLDASGNLAIGATNAGGNILLLERGANSAVTLQITNSDVGSSAIGRIFFNLQGGSTYIENRRIGGLMCLGIGSGGSNECITLTPQQSVVLGTAAIATNATNGFFYVAGCAGTPTGTPTAYTGRVPIVVDTTNHKLYFYSGGAWRDAGP